MWSEVSYTMTSINDEMSLDITTEEEELENKKENKRKKAKDNYNRFNIKNNDEFNPIKSIDAPNIFDRKVLHSIHKSKTYIHKTMKYQVNNNIFNNTENKYEEKPKINDVLKNQKKTIDTRKNQNNIQKIDIKDNKNIKSNETINIFSIVEKKKDGNNTNDNNTFLNHNRNNVNINNSVDKNGNEKNELNIINNVKEKNKKIISKKEKNNATDNKNIFPNIKKIDIKDNKNIKSDENTFVEKKIDGNNASNNNIFPHYNKKNKSINNVIGEYENNELNIINHLNKENKKQNSKEKSGIIDKEGKDNIIDNKKLKTKKKRRKFNFR